MSKKLKGGGNTFSRRHAQIVPEVPIAQELDPNTVYIENVGTDYQSLLAERARLMDALRRTRQVLRSETSRVFPQEAINRFSARADDIRQQLRDINQQIDSYTEVQANGAGFNPIKSIKNTYNKTKSFLTSGSQQFTSKVQKILQKVGNEQIQSIVVCRCPIPSMVQQALQIASFNQVPYEKLFHLFIIINGHVLLEKNSVINMDLRPKIPANTEQMQSQAPSNTTIQQLVERCYQAMGPQKFFSYSSYDNNCQYFILNLLNSNGVLTNELSDFIKQNTESIFANNPTLRKLTNNITDMDGRFHEVIGGEIMGGDIENKAMFNTIKIKVPHDMINIGKRGNVTIAKTLTKTGMLSKRNKKPAIILQDGHNINHVEVIDQGTVENPTHIKQRQSKLRTIKKKLDKLPQNEKPTVKLPKIKDDSDKILDTTHIQNFNNKLKDIPKVLKIGDINNPDIEVLKKGEVFKQWSVPMYKGEMQRTYQKYVVYYFKEGYKYMVKQPLPTENELHEVMRFIYKLQKPQNFKTIFTPGSNIVTAAELFWDSVRRTKVKNWKIIMKIAYNDGINKNSKIFNHTALLWKNHLEAQEENERQEQEQRNIDWANRSEDQKKKTKKFYEKLESDEMNFYGGSLKDLQLNCVRQLTLEELLSIIDHETGEILLQGLHPEANALIHERIRQLTRPTVAPRQTARKRMNG